MADLVNTNNLFKKITRYFQEGDWIAESIQNAQRSGASYIKFSFTAESRVLLIEDDGEGIKDLIGAITLANSDWANDNVEDQDPAGMGLLSLFSKTDRINIQSGTQRLAIDTEKFFNSEDYRSKLPGNIQTCAGIKGTWISMLLKNDIDESYLKDELKESAKWSLIDIVYNGDNFGSHIFSVPPENAFEFEYQGCRGYCLLRRYSYAMPIKVNWYGQLIETHVHRGNVEPPIEVYLLVDKGSPLTPKLPTRDAILNDDKTRKFVDFVEEKLYSYVEAQIAAGIINDYFAGIYVWMIGYAKEHKKILPDNMPVYLKPVVIDNSEFREEDPKKIPLSDVSSQLYVSNAVSLVVDGEEMEPNSLFDIIGEVFYLPHPYIHDRIESSKIVERVSLTFDIIDEVDISYTGPDGAYQISNVQIDIQFQDGSDERRTSLAESSVVIADADNCVSILVEEGQDFENSIKEVTKFVFDHFIYYEDGDQYDTQSFEYERHITKRLRRHFGKVNPLLLLKELGVPFSDLSSPFIIEFDPKSKKIFYKDDKIEKEFSVTY